MLSGQQQQQFTRFGMGGATCAAASAASSSTGGADAGFSRATTGASYSNGDGDFRLCLRNTFVDVDEVAEECPPRRTRSCSPTTWRRRVDCEPTSAFQSEEDYVASLERKVKDWCSDRGTTSSNPPDLSSYCPSSLHSDACSSSVHSDAGSAQAEEDVFLPPPEPTHLRPLRQDWLVAGAVNFGSVGHPHLCHRPCRFFKEGLCTSGDECDYCHEEHNTRAAHLDKRNRNTMMHLSRMERILFLAEVLRLKVGSVGLGQEAVEAVDKWAAAVEVTGAGDASEQAKTAPNKSSMNRLLVCLANMKISAVAWVLCSLQQEAEDVDGITAATKKLVDGLRALVVR